MLEPIAVRIARELDVQPRQIEAAVRLLDEGATVPFIARYRKEATAGLDDTQLRRLSERLLYLRELEDRRQAILRSVEEQGKLSAPLRAAIEAAQTKVELEDQYLPYRPKRRSKASVALEAGLEPLARALLADPTLEPLEAAARYASPERGVADAAAALEGARAILIEQFAQDAQLRAQTRAWIAREASLVAQVRDEKRADAEAQRFRDYFAHAEPLARVPGHRALAMLRAQKEEVVELRLGLGEAHDSLARDPTGEGERLLARRFGLAARGRRADAWLAETARQCFRQRLGPQLGSELIAQLRERAEAEAIGVFAANLRELLLAAPAGPRTILGLDPGLRTGCKIAVVDRTGRLLGASTIYPHAPRNDWAGSLHTLGALCEKLRVELIAIGNGTASRETDKLVSELIRERPEPKPAKLVVSEAGASVYSASERASQELPELDVSLRGAVSIARRLQDPLAELVKIEPKAIGVGQYQHDVDQGQLARALEGVVEDCVNRVGVDLNTASEDLLARVAGLGPAVARNIVAHRDRNGAFRTRRQLLQVSRLGPVAFEQCAGFLRIPDGDDPLDRSAVHPEAYPVVERILARSGRALPQLLGDRDFLRGLDPRQFTDERFGVPTVSDILAELEKPGRDPRPAFVTAAFREGVQELGDLRAGMQLEGVVTNVAAFGAFVDIGVHQDGLVHISQLSDRFVKDPAEVAKVGQVVQVKVLEVDLERRRISLTMKRNERPAPAAERDATRGPAGPDPRAKPPAAAGPRKPAPVYPLAAQLAKLKRPKD
jgi:uncharacterized protein